MLVPLLFAGHALIIFTLLRMMLLFANWADVPHTIIAFARTFFTGLRMDVAVILVLSIPFIFYAAIVSDGFFRKNWHLKLLETWYVAALYVFIFLNVSDYFFFDEFNSRFNYIAIDYLIATPREVVENVWQSYPVPLVMAAVAALTALLYWMSRKTFLKWATTTTSASQRLAMPLAALLLTALALKSVNIKMLSKDPNRIMAEISADGFYTLGYAMLTNQMSYDEYYQTMNITEAFENVKAHIHGPDDKFLDDAANPIRRIVPGKKGLGNANVVIILEESLGAKFSAKLRHNPLNLTPRLDQLMDKSFIFSRFYSTGTRTVRALEAVLASFPPIPGASIVKRADSHNISTIARTLKAVGYNTVFIYGGRGLFDNMRGFMLDNGYDRFIEQSDYPSPTFTSAWGVCDEDIFAKSLQTFDQMQATGKPFFATILTVSNHKPYTYPKGRIDFDPDQHSRDHAVKYADWALGDFFEKAPTHPFYKNTIFVILGDHGARVYGADFIPIESYEIPMLIHGPALLPAPHMIDTLACSMDITPTILGLLGLEYPSTFYGRDLLRLRPDQNYVLLQHDRDVGFFDGEKLSVLSTQKSAGVYNYDSATKRFTKDKSSSTANQTLVQNAISFYQSAYKLYSDGQYTAAAAAAPQH